MLSMASSSEQPEVRILVPSFQTIPSSTPSQVLKTQAINAADQPAPLPTRTETSFGPATRFIQPHRAVPDITELKSLQACRPWAPFGWIVVLRRAAPRPI